MNGMRAKQGDSLLGKRFVGREDAPPTQWDNTGEFIRWVGKPWRRLELLTHTFLWKGEEEVTDRTLTLHIGLRRLGIFLTIAVARQPGYDYSEERL